MKRFLLLLAFLASRLLALNITPPSFDQLVEGADAVVRSEVLSSRCEWRGEDSRRHIVTIVRIRIERCIAGSAPEEMDLVLLGGVIGDRGLQVSGQLSFAKGDRDILFLKNNGTTICPVSGMNHGRYWIVPSSDGATQLVTRTNGDPLRSVAQVSVPLDEISAGRVSSLSTEAAQGTLSLEAFESLITTRRTELRKASQN